VFACGFVNVFVIEQAMKHEMEDARLFDVTKYACTCGKNCASNFPRTDFVLLIHSLRSMKSLELRQFITYSLTPGFVLPHKDEMIDASQSGKMVKRRRKVADPSKPRRAHVKYSLFGVEMCRTAFCKIVGVSSETIVRLMHTISVCKGGVPLIEEQRTGGKERETGKRSTVLKFLKRYGERNGYPCPSHNPAGVKQGITDEDVVFLPSKTEKMAVYEEFVDHPTYQKRNFFITI
jgi:hypothetical protein